WFVTRMVMRNVNLYLDTLYSAFEMITSGVTTVQHLHGRIPGKLDQVDRGCDEAIRAYQDVRATCEHPQAVAHDRQPCRARAVPRMAAYGALQSVADHAAYGRRCPKASNRWRLDGCYSGMGRICAKRCIPPVSWTQGRARSQ